MIKITLSNTIVFRNGGHFSRFVRVKIIVGLMRLIVDGLLMEQGPNTIIGRGHLDLLRILLCGYPIGQPKDKASNELLHHHSNKKTLFPPAIDFGMFNKV